MPEVIEIEVGGRIERGGERVEVEVEEGGDEALDFDAALEVLAERAAVELRECFDAVPDDIPAENLLVDEGEQDAAGEFGEVGVVLDEGLGVEDDDGLEIVAADLR